MTDAAFWDRIAPRYAKSPIRNLAAYEATLARVRDHLKPTDRVLETGCGTGSTALKLAGAVAQYTATDVSPGMIAIARQRAEAARTPNLTFEVAAADADGAAGSYDAVLGFSLLHLVRDLDGAIARARTLLRPGGLYITKTPCIGNMNPLIRLALPVMQWVGKAPFAQVLTREALQRRIAAAGFDIVEANSFHGAPAAWFVVARRL